MSKGGRPTKFKQEYIDLAYKFCLLGADDEKLSKLFEVDVSTISNWKLKHPKFLEAIKNGKDIADSEIAESLYQRGKGYTHDEEKIFCTDGKVTKVVTKKHYPPDTAAAFIWLKNRQKDLWRDRKEQETIVRHVTEDLSDSELENIAARGSNRAAKEAQVTQKSGKLH